MLGVSRQTLYRRLEEFDISSTDYTDLCDNDIDEVLTDIKQQFPNDGEVMVQG